MSDILIDLTTEDNSKNKTPSVSSVPSVLQPIVIDNERRSSFENNPFDKAEMEVRMLNDPFEMVFKEAKNSNAININNSNSPVQTGTLISIDESDQSCQIVNSSKTVKIYPSSESKCSKKSSIVKPLERTQSDTLISVGKNASKQIELMGNKSRSSSLGNQGKIDLRRLSLSRSLLTYQKNDESAENDEVNALTNRFANHSVNQNNTDDSIDDLSALRPHWIDSENDCDSDIEELKIPLLQEIENNQKTNPPEKMDKSKTTIQDEFMKFKSQQTLNKIDEDNLHEKDLSIKNELGTIKNLSDNVSAKNPSVGLQKSDLDNDIGTSLNILRNAINQISNENLKTKAMSTLDSLKEIFTSVENETAAPRAIIRQGTFSYVKQTNTKEDTENPNSETAEMVERLGNVFGHEGVGLLNINGPSENPMYIVVMNQIPSNQSICLTTPMRPSAHLKNRRSKSLSINEKPASAINALQTALDLKQAPSSTVDSAISTAVQRRKSFSGSSAQLTVAKSNAARRSVANRALKISPPKAIQKKYLLQDKGKLSPAISTPRKSILKDLSSSKVTSSININRPVPLSSQSKFKLKTVGTKTRSTGPIKATVPFEKLSSSLSPAEQDQIKKFITSTPVVRNPNTLPSASSTPMIKVDGIETNLSGPLKMPLKKTEIPTGLTTPIKSRLSYLAVTPNPKGNSMISRLGRQRSLSDLSNKSVYQMTDEKSSPLAKSKLVSGLEKPRSKENITPIRK